MKTLFKLFMYFLFFSLIRLGGGAVALAATKQPNSAATRSINTLHSWLVVEVSLVGGGVRVTIRVARIKSPEAPFSRGCGRALLPSSPPHGRMADSLLLLLSTRFLLLLMSFLLSRITLVIVILLAFPLFLCVVVSSDAGARALSLSLCVDAMFRADAGALGDPDAPPRR